MLQMKANKQVGGKEGWGKRKGGGKEGRRKGREGERKGGGKKSDCIRCKYTV